MANKAESFDLDGVIFDRQIKIQVGALIGYVRNGLAIYEPPSVLPEVQRLIDNTSITSLVEAISFCLHSRRHVRLGVREFLTSRDSDIYGDTGRSNKRLWVEMTYKTLKDGDISGFFRDIFFKPKGVRTIESKGAALAELSRRYNHVTHYDDNPADVLGLAKHFPEIQFVVIQDLSTGILFSRVEMAEYPNVKRVAVLSDVI